MGKFKVGDMVRVLGNASIGPTFSTRLGQDFVISNIFGALNYAPNGDWFYEHEIEIVGEDKFADLRKALNIMRDELPHSWALRTDASYCNGIVEVFRAAEAAGLIADDPEPTRAERAAKAITDLTALRDGPLWQKHVDAIDSAVSLLKEIKE